MYKAEYAAHNIFKQAGMDSIFSRLPQLTSLNITCALEKGVHLDNIKRLSNLERLYICENNLGSEEIKPLLKLEKLQVLHISVNPFGDRGLMYICRMHTLVELSMANNNVVGESSGFLAQLTNLKFLNYGTQKLN